VVLGGDLIDTVALRVVPAERSPQIAIDWTKVAGLAAKTACVFFVGPLFPNIHASGAEVRFIGIAGKKPKQFFGDPAKGNTLGGYDRESGAQVKTSLKTEVRDCTDAGAVLVLSPMLEN
jgi:1-acyl-sn-glycerol-3-phosphate acyltransferase